MEEPKIGMWGKGLNGGLYFMGGGRLAEKSELLCSNKF